MVEAHFSLLQLSIPSVLLQYRHPARHRRFFVKREAEFLQSEEHLSKYLIKTVESKSAVSDEGLAITKDIFDIHLRYMTTGKRRILKYMT